MRKPKPWTMKEIKFLKENYENMTHRELAESLNRTPASVSYMIRIAGLKKERKRAEYAVYKGDSIIAQGTAIECAELLNVSPKYIQYLTTPSNQKRISKLIDQSNAAVAVRVDEVV